MLTIKNNTVFFSVASPFSFSLPFSSFLPYLKFLHPSYNHRISFSLWFKFICIFCWCQNFIGDNSSFWKINIRIVGLRQARVSPVGHGWLVSSLVFLKKKLFCRWGEREYPSPQISLKKTFLFRAKESLVNKNLHWRKIKKNTNKIYALFSPSFLSVSDKIFLILWSMQSVSH